MQEDVLAGEGPVPKSIHEVHARQDREGAQAGIDDGIDEGILGEAIVLVEHGLVS